MATQKFNFLKPSVLGDPMKRTYVIVLLCFLFGSSPIQASDTMKAFPPADAGMVRHVLQLPEQKDEDSCKVELIVGKTVQVDAKNRYFFGGAIKEETITGWGFTRYVVHTLGPMAGTLMAIDPKAPKAERFITLGTEPYLIRYNSRLPIVVYVPEGTEVRYRIWSSSPETKTMTKG